MVASKRARSMVRRARQKHAGVAQIAVKLGKKIYHKVIPKQIAEAVLFTRRRKRYYPKPLVPRNSRYYNYK